MQCIGWPRKLKLKKILVYFFRKAAKLLETISAYQKVLIYVTKQNISLTEKKSDARFWLQIFVNQFPPVSEYPIGAILSYMKICGDIDNFMFITGVNYFSDRLFSG